MVTLLIPAAAEPLCYPLRIHIPWWDGMGVVHLRKGRTMTISTGSGLVGLLVIILIILAIIYFAKRV
jgi:hypothetical protein